MVSAGPQVAALLRLPISYQDYGDGKLALSQFALRAEWESSLAVWGPLSLSVGMGLEVAPPSAYNSSSFAFFRGYSSMAGSCRLGILLGKGAFAPALSLGAAYHLGLWQDSALAFRAAEALGQFRFPLPPFLPRSWDLEEAILLPFSVLWRADSIAPGIGLGLSLFRQGKSL